MKPTNDQKIKQLLDSGELTINDDGVVFRTTYKQDGTSRTKQMALHLCANGYQRVLWYTDKTCWKLRVHRIQVIKQQGIQALPVHHKDWNKLNNSPDNLAYCTVQETMSFERNRGLLTRSQLKDLMTRHANGETMTALAEEAGTQHGILRLMFRRASTAVSYKIFWNGSVEETACLRQWAEENAICYTGLAKAVRQGRNYTPRGMNPIQAIRLGGR
jgi:hypothetical protein